MKTVDGPTPIVCRKCDRQAALILDGLFYCSSHGLIVVLERLESVDPQSDLLRVG
jgi:hypothetical protein